MHHEKRKLPSGKIQKLFFLIFCSIVLINPIPLGSNRVWAWSFESIVVMLLLLLMLVCTAFTEYCVNWRALKRMKIERNLMVAWILVGVLYVIPLPYFFLDIISPNVATAYKEIGADFGYLSLDVHASFLTLMLGIYYVCLFVLGVVLINSRKRLIVVLGLFLFLGLGESIYGMFLVSIGQTGTFVQVQSVSVFNASGTFINKNHLVAFLSMCFFIGLGLRMIVSNKNKGLLNVDRKLKVIKFMTSPTRLLDACLFLIMLGIWNTHSRAGLASFILSVVFYFSLLFFTKKTKKLKLKWLVTAFTLLMALMIFVSDDVDYYLNSLSENSQVSMDVVKDSAQGRILAVNQFLNNIGKHWVSGVGPGAYQVFFVNYRNIDQLAYFDHAHNDYIEFMVEYGILSVILLGLIIVIMYEMFVFIFKTRSQFSKLIVISSISCVVYMLLHGSVDFNAQIPANVVTIIIAISMIYSRVLNTTRKTDEI